MSRFIWTPKFRLSCLPAFCDDSCLNSLSGNCPSGMVDWGIGLVFGVGYVWDPFSNVMDIYTSFWEQMPRGIIRHFCGLQAWKRYHWYMKSDYIILRIPNLNRWNKKQNKNTDDDSSKMSETKHTSFLLPRIPATSPRRCWALCGYAQHFIILHMLNNLVL